MWNALTLTLSQRKRGPRHWRWELPWTFLLLGHVLVLSGCSGSRDATEPTASKTTTATPKFAGMEACVACHADKVTSHRESGHASTFVSTADSAVAQSFCNTGQNDESPYHRYDYECDAEGLMVKMPRVFGNDRFPLHYAIGSGTHAVTLLSVIPSATGQTVGIEHRWSWFAEGNVRRITPGQENLIPTQEVDFFGMVFKQSFLEKCVGCHTTHAEVRNDALVNLVPNVTCEACHGSAVKHVELAKVEKTREAIAAISVSRGSVAEMDLCGKCHRLPKDIDAARLKRYPRSLVRFQPVGLMQSRCLTESVGKMSCSTCHDPHEKSAAKTSTQYEAQCVDCHSAGKSKECRASHRADCVRCHMPRIEISTGLRFHDHWIRVRPADDPALKPYVPPTRVDAEPGHAGH